MICNHCRIEKPTSEFHRLHDGFAPKCKQCIREYQREYNRRPEIKERDSERKKVERAEKPWLELGRQRRYLATDNGRRKHSEISKRYRQTKKYKIRAAKYSVCETRLKYRAEYAIKYPDRIKARYELNKAISRKAITRAKICEKCGGVGRIEGHHYLGYDPIHWFEVHWLCTSCHAKECV